MPSPTVIATSDVDTIPAGGTVNFSSTGSNATTYLWDFGDGIFSSLTPVSHTYNTSGFDTVILKGEFANGCASYDTLYIRVLNTVEITDVDIANLVKIYPNPAIDYTTISFDVNTSDEIEVYLLNIEGKTLYQEKNIDGKSTLEINTRNYERGMYFVKIRIGNNEVIKKVILTR